jgi:rubrerythrin
MKTFQTVNEVLDFAIAKEIAAHRFYNELALEEAQHKLRLEIEYDLTTF